MMVVTPVPESSAEGKVSELYMDIRESLGCSAVPGCFRAFAEYPGFLDLAWRRLQPPVSTDTFRRETEALAAIAGDGIKRSYYTPDHVAALVRGGLTDDTEIIRRTILYFDAVNPSSLLFISGLHRLLNGQPIHRAAVVSAKPSGKPVPRWSIGSIPDGSGEFEERVRAIFDDIRDTLNCSMVPDELAALAQWPDYLDYAWNKQKAFIRGARFLELRDRIATEAASRMTSTADIPPITDAELREAGLTDPGRQRMREMVECFAGLLPTQILIVSTLKVGLGIPLTQPPPL